MDDIQGSYSPNTEEKPLYEKKCKCGGLRCSSASKKKTLLNVPFLVEPETAPTGMITRGHYNAVSKFVDDDNQTHLKFEWSFDIKKDW